MQSVRVWDIPVRLFHWLLVLSITGLFITANLGGNWMEWHKKMGFFTLGLVTFRIVWGFIGSYHARFSSFVRGPAAVIAYARGLGKSRANFGAELGVELDAQPSSQPNAKPNNKHFLGHNPMGALSVLALLASIAFQAVTGLYANDDILLEGPYASAVSKQLSDQITNLHKINSDVLIALIVLHLAAIIFYTIYKKEALVKAMITGEKMLNSGPEAESQALLAGTYLGGPAEKARPAWRSWLLAVVVAALTYVVVMRAFW